MAKRRVTPEMARFLKDKFGWSDQQLKLLTPMHWKIIDAFPRREGYRVVAEVLQTTGCVLQPRVGHRIVFSPGGVVLPQESTFPQLCLWALAPMFPIFQTIYDRFAEGIDPNPIWNLVKCADVGIECGGFGEVLFKIYVQPPARTVRLKDLAEKMGISPTRLRAFLRAQRPRTAELKWKRWLLTSQEAPEVEAAYKAKKAKREGNDKE